MIRSIALCLLLLLTPSTAAHAFGFRSGSSACPSPSSDGSIIFPNTNCTVTAQGHSWFFCGISADKVNYQIAYDDTSHCGWNTGLSIARANNGNMYWSTKWPTCGTNWQESLYSGNAFSQPPPSATQLTNFQDTTKGTTAGSLAQLNISAGDNIQITQAPLAYGFNCWPYAFAISTPNITLTLNNATFNDVNNGDAMVYVRAAGVMITTDAINGSAINVASHQHGVCDPLPGVRVYRNEPNTTIGGLSTTALLTIQNGEEGILTSYGDGTTTIHHVTLSNIGANGLCHGIYISNGSPPSPFTTEDPTMRDDVSDVVFINPNNGGSGGPAFKFDDACDGSPCNEVNLEIYCTVANDNVCDTGTTYDGQCGGLHNITAALFENYGYGANTGYSWAMVQVNWGKSGCPQNAPPKTFFHFDQTLWVIDGQTSGTGPQGAVLVCANQWDYGTSGRSCDSAADAQAGIVAITNSQIVDNTTTRAAHPVWAGFDVTVDINNTVAPAGPTSPAVGDTNTYYASRADACAVNVGFNWAGCNTAPYVKGAFPFMPSRPMTMPTQAQQASAAVAAKCSGNGTQTSPYNGCA